MCYVTLSTAAASIRSEVHAFLHAAPDDLRFHRNLQPSGEGVVNPVLDDAAVRADTDLTRVTDFRRHHVAHGRIQISIIEHDEKVFPPSSFETFLTVPARSAMSCVPTWSSR